ncbi:hypothetical protein EJ110_NYTH50604 [Nymphaea thermarum]|nr:hypothetical protein EJ110_NYTH50604 [Nymphaea thermarum]
MGLPSWELVHSLGDPLLSRSSVCSSFRPVSGISAHCSHLRGSSHLDSTRTLVPRTAHPKPYYDPKLTMSLATRRGHSPCCGSLRSVPGSEDPNNQREDHSPTRSSMNRTSTSSVTPTALTALYPNSLWPRVLPFYSSRSGPWGHGGAFPTEAPRKKDRPNSSIGRVMESKPNVRSTVSTVASSVSTDAF